MSSLSGLLDLSRSALLADQAALNATANNVSNQNTVGYTKQVVTWTSGDTVSLSGSAVSSGAPTVSTSSVRDRVLEMRLEQQTQQQASTSSEAAVLAQVEDVFSITSTSTSEGSTQLGTAMDSFFASLSALAANPSDAPTEQAALSAAANLTSAFNSAATGLAQISDGMSTTLSSSVSSINALTSSLAKVNGEIGNLAPGKDGGTLEDQRQLMISQLSALVGLNQITTENNGLTLTTTGGTVLVAGSQSYSLSAVSVGGTTAIDGSDGSDVTSQITGGSVGGQLAAQSTDLPALSAQLDQLAYRIGTAVNNQNVLGNTSTGVAGAVLFTLPTSAAGAAASIMLAPTATIATAASGEGSAGNSNVTALADLSSAVDGNNETVGGQYATMLSGIGSKSASLQSLSTVQQASLTQLTTQRDSLSGVNLDTEASNLTTFQRAYQAAAQLLTIVDRLMASAINLGTEATVS